jgi:hypothetical protein
MNARLGIRSMLTCHQYIRRQNLTPQPLLSH